ncbi:MAG: hypothetical protein KGD73_05295 [Candidatus Lokiarchaeota archaeon]|nr:hypothetical protein [Candidatus Lokiarchaeota archaeon]
MSESDIWSFQLDWLNIINLLGFHSINQIPETKKQKTLKKITKLYGTEVLLTLKPNELDELVADELKILLKREIMEDARQKEKIEREIRHKVLPLKNGKILGINMSDLRDLDPNADMDEIMKYFSKKFLKNDDNDENDDDPGDIDEDKTGIYI